METDRQAAARGPRAVLAAPRRAARWLGRQHRLDELITGVAADLMPVRAEGLDAATAALLERLRGFFEVDTVFLRSNDHARGVTVLLDEAPRRPHVPDPDPLGEVPFDADPVWAAVRDLRGAYVKRPKDTARSYLERVRAGSGVEEVSLAMVPLRSGETTEGVLGFIRFGDRRWPAVEVRALQAIASLLTQAWARVAAEQRLHHQAEHDDLTGLGNRRRLLTELERRASRSEGGLAVVFLDLDNLKDLNDALGHTVGDRFLVGLATRLRSAMRAGDLVGRVGGDEFLVLLDGATGPAEARAVAERLVAVAAEPVQVGGHRLRRTVSAGVATARAGEAGADEVLRHADLALYEAKARGRNRVAVYDEPLRAAVEERFGDEALLARAIEADGLALHYQPEVELATGRLTALEALVRWEHPRKGLLTAAAFVNLAEDAGLGLELGRRVLDGAAAQAAAWSRAHPGLDVPVRVNVSPLQLRDRGLAAQVAQRLAAHGLEPRRLSVEVTEHGVMRDVDRASRELAELRALGVSVALDDFGTGHSSLAQLKRLPLDYLKIDQSFVAGLGVDPTDRAIVEAVAGLADALGLGLIAEGVAAPAHVAHLREVGCERGQGFLLCRPLPPDRLARVLDRGGVDMDRDAA